jgi:hypothetical protein
VLLRRPAALEAQAGRQRLGTTLEAQRGEARCTVLLRPVAQLVPRATMMVDLSYVKVRPQAPDNPVGGHAGGGGGAQEEADLGGSRRI